jgi:oxygen-independent coproporphyrinogen-3 oxidase
VPPQHPRTLDRGYAEALVVAGVTRASLGVQTFSDAVQRRINRVQPYRWWLRP